MSDDHGTWSLQRKTRNISNTAVSPLNGTGLGKPIPSSWGAISVALLAQPMSCTDSSRYCLHALPYESKPPKNEGSDRNLGFGVISDKPRVCSRNAGFPQTSWVPTGSVRRIFSWRVFGPVIPSYFLFPTMAPIGFMSGGCPTGWSVYGFGHCRWHRKVATLSAKTCSNSVRSLRPDDTADTAVHGYLDGAVFDGNTLTNTKEGPREVVWAKMKAWKLVDETECGFWVYVGKVEELHGCVVDWVAHNKDGKPLPLSVSGQYVTIQVPK